MLRWATDSGPSNAHLDEAVDELWHEPGLIENLSIAIRKFSIQSRVFSQRLFSLRKIRPEDKDDSLGAVNDGSRHASLTSLSKAALRLRARKVHPDGNNLDGTAMRYPSHASLTRANGAEDRSRSSMFTEDRSRSSMFTQSRSHLGDNPQIKPQSSNSGEDLLLNAEVSGLH
jgi:hypothetical protein